MESIHQQLHTLLQNPQFAKEFEANAKQAYEKHSGEKWPYRETHARVMADDAKTMHVTFPKPPGVLYDDELSGVAGGFSDAASAASASTFGSFIGCLGSAGTASSNSGNRVLQAVGQIMGKTPAEPEDTSTAPPTS